jgi:hypothetical protein
LYRRVSRDIREVRGNSVVDSDFTVKDKDFSGSRVVRRVGRYLDTEDSSSNRGSSVGSVDLVFYGN